MTYEQFIARLMTNQKNHDLEEGFFFKTRISYTIRRKVTRTKLARDLPVAKTDAIGNKLTVMVEMLDAPIA